METIQELLENVFTLSNILSFLVGVAGTTITINCSSKKYSFNLKNKGKFEGVNCIENNGEINNVR